MAAYTIVVAGHLDERWEPVFAGFVLERRIEADGLAVTVLNGILADPPALFGFVIQLQNYGLSLISLQPARGSP